MSKKGQPIAVLANPDVVRSSVKVRADLDGSRAHLAVLLAGSRPETLQRFRAEVSRKQIELTQAPGSRRRT